MNLQKLIATLFFGVILTAFNVCAVETLAKGFVEIASEFGSKPLGLLKALLIDGATVFILWVIPPVFAFRISWEAVNDDNAIALCRNNWWRFLAAIAIPFISFVCVYLLTHL